MRRFALCLSLTCGTAAAAQTHFLVGVRETGDLVRIDLATGIGTQLSGSGVRCTGAFGYRGTGFTEGSYDYIFAIGTEEPHVGHRLTLDRWRGAIWKSTATTGIPAGHTLAGMAGLGDYYCVLQPEDPQASDILAKLARNSTSWTIVGPTGRNDLTCIAAFNGGLFALGSQGNGNLYSINSTTGVATLIGGGSFDGDILSMTAGPDGQLLCCGANLRSINPATGQTTLIGPTGFSSISSLALFRDDICRIECDGTHHGVTANDFQCFLNRFAAGDPWCNCDESTGAPLLTANDFQCILNEYARFLAGDCSF